jgi:uncharacterized protein YhaN
LGTKGETIKDNVAFWRQELKALEQYGNLSQGTEYDESTVTRLKEAKSTSERSLAAIHNNMAGFRKRLEEIEKEANKTLQLQADYLPCATAIDLKAVRDELSEFIDSYVDTRDTVLKVMAIFEEIETEEQKKVAELFGAGSPVSNYFGEITDKSYDAVLFNQEGSRIEVRRKDGQILEAEKLSGGAYDQLYLAIRLALGERILQGTKGFFVMDDPFVKADPARLQKQIEVLTEISQSGWQVIYFSAKGEMKEMVKPLIKRGAVHCVEIQGIFS